MVPPGAGLGFHRQEYHRMSGCARRSELEDLVERDLENYGATETPPNSAHLLAFAVPDSAGGGLEAQTKIEALLFAGADTFFPVSWFLQVDTGPAR